MQETTVEGQRWTSLPVPALGEWTPTDSVCVVLPARDNQTELDRTLAALVHQTYPADLLEVVVVDDSSEPPLVLPDLAPAGTRVVRRDEAQSHGSGAARHAGALASDSDIVLFLDSDMLADPRHVEAHARWHHVCDHAVVLGHKWFVAVDDLTPESIAAAGASGTGVAALVEGRRQGTHAWQEDLIRDQDNLTHDVDDAFLAVVGATVSLRRAAYDRCGGFASFGLRGIVDTEFGYRAFTSGCVIVPEEQARSWHQGSRNFASRGGEIKKERLGLAANHLPVPMFRTQNTGRRWSVPMVRAVIDVTGTDLTQEWQAERLLLTVDSVLASDVTDLAVTVVDDGGLPSWWHDYVAAESRVEVTADRRDVASGFPSPFTVVVPPGVVLGQGSLSAGLGLLSEEVRVVRTLPAWGGAQGLEIWRTRTLERALRVGLDRVPEDVLGEHWVSERALHVTRPQPRLTPQGMVTTW
ncbi:glycosyltransferase family A protein [Ornithinimicrobium cavernae]|uniref:glycosyltransferase family A protein n=1 Tax=Ornithinimicrobium cavernae TaxID=2666047 RepID=UPI000D6925EF|nr:glycosyltransferase family 2 protein [Ornithinimicrobium cavernae]